MTHALDTNVVSGTFRELFSTLAHRVAAKPRSDVAIPSVVRAEILFGAIKGAGQERTRRLRLFLAEFPELPFDEKCVEVYAQARADLERTGQRIGALDLLIAATALANDLVLVTHNTAEFSRVPGLRLEDWQ